MMTSPTVTTSGARLIRVPSPSLLPLSVKQRFDVKFPHLMRAKQCLDAALVDDLNVVQSGLLPRPSIEELVGHAHPFEGHAGVPPCVSGVSGHYILDPIPTELLSFNGGCLALDQHP